jgi:hypothetical protein
VAAFDAELKPRDGASQRLQTRETARLEGGSAAPRWRWASEPPAVLDEEAFLRATEPRNPLVTDPLESLSVRGFGLSLTPAPELVEILGSDLALPQPVEEMISHGRGQIRPEDLRHSVAEGHQGQFLLQARLLTGVVGLGQPFG